MGRPSKRVKRVRTKEEFDVASLMRRVSPPRGQSNGLYAWELVQVAAARDAHLTGNFRRSAPLSVRVKTDAAIASALKNRLAPFRSLPVELEPAAKTARAKKICDEGEGLFGAKGVGARPETFVKIAENLVQLGVAIGINLHTARADGSRVDVEHHAWPMERVWWCETRQCFQTTTDQGILDICHADGMWTVYRASENSPWEDGCIVPAALVWADRAYGIRDRALSSNSHGNAKWIGELPPGVPTDGEQAQAFIEMLAMMHQQLPFGIRPSGSKTEMIVNTSTAWQIFQEIVKGGLEDGARIYNGHDGTIKASGGNYVKDGFLFGVSVDLVEGDLRTIERGFREGTMEPWAAINYGSSELAPNRVWKMPDADADQRAASAKERRAAFWADLETAKRAAQEAGCFTTQWLQDYARNSAKEFGIDCPNLTPDGEGTSQTGAPTSPSLGSETVPVNASVLRLPSAARAQRSPG
jgi:hypothetical protein